MGPAGDVTGAPLSSTSELITFLGGQICAPTGECISFPPGSIDGSVQVTLRVFTPDQAIPPPPDGYYYIGNIVDLLPPGVTFDPPAILTLPIPPGELGTNDATDVRLWVYVNGEWVLLPGVVDRIAMTISVGLSHFTLYTAAAPLEATTGQPPASGVEPPAPATGGTTGLPGTGTGTLPPDSPWRAILMLFAGSVVTAGMIMGLRTMRAHD